MSCYVDPVFQWCCEATKEGQARRVGARNGNRWSHMTADTEAELHELADRLGLRRAWSQGDHYDLTPGKRAQAVRLGAVEVDARELCHRARILRLTKGAGAPPEEVQKLLDRMKQREDEILARPVPGAPEAGKS